MSTRRWIIGLSLVGLLASALGGYVFYIEERLNGAEYYTDMVMRRIHTLEHRVDEQDAINASLAAELRGDR